MNIQKIILVIAASALVISCSMAPQKQLIETRYDIPEHYDRLNTKVNKDSVIQTKWWLSFNDEILNALIDTVVARNLDVKIALQRVEQLQNSFRQARSQRFPSLSLSGDNTASKRAMFFGDRQLDIDNVQYSVSAALNFELDIWGRLNHLENAAIAELMASKHDLESLYLAITAQTVNLYYNIKAAEWQLQLTDKLINSYENDLRLEKLKYEKGVGSLLNVALVEQTLNQTKSQQEAELQQLRLLQNSLSILSVAYPNLSIETSTSTLQDTDLPMEPIPVGAPSSLLKRRNDIIAAEYKLEAARQRIGAARADFFPKISLTGSLGFLSQDLADLFKDDYMTSSYGGNFQGTYSAGGKTANLNLNWALYEQAELNYRKIVLNAFKEVEDALLKLESSYKQLGFINQQITAAKQALDIRKEQYTKGVGSYDRLIEANLSYFRTRYNLVTAYKNIFLNRTALHLAIGGGF
jgi:multidrug efflux system outer membrane protein